MNTLKNENSDSNENLSRILKSKFGTEFKLPETINNLSTIEEINNRSVCRDYDRSMAVSDESINLLCATALSSPSKSDLQQASIIVIKDPEIRKKINKMNAGAGWIESAPSFLVVCADHYRLRTIFTSKGSDFPNNHLDSFLNAAVDAGIVLSSLVQTANLLGLGSCPISEVRDYIKEFSEILKLPQWVFPICGLTLGYPIKNESLSPRLGLASTMHLDTYKTESTLENINEYDQRRMSQKAYPSQRDLETHGEAREYGWSEDKFRQYLHIQRDDFGDYIRGQGFSLD